MYYRRKIDRQLDAWLKKKDKIPALIVGIRQCGKTESIKEFAKRNNLKLIMINFWTHPEYSADFEKSLDVDDLISNISLRFPHSNIKPETTLIFFDEIQDCPKARLSLKSFKEDGRYSVIASGSLLGINSYVKGDNSPAPTGSEDIYEMKTMDFEEFLWANGYDEKQIEYLINCFANREKIDPNIHNLYKELFLKYASIGGFPKVIATYLETKSIKEAYKVLNNIVFEMKTDFGRRKSKDGKPIFNKSEMARIENAFDLMPVFLAKENKRYIVSKIQTGKQYDKNDAIEYLRQAHIVKKVYNVEVPSLPLFGEAITSQFKLFPTDIGIVTSMYGIDTIRAILNNNLGQGKGAIYEAIVFDSLYKADIDAYYYAKESGLEIDFVISYDGYATLIEAKSTTGNTKSSKTIMKHPDHYGKVKLIKIGEYNIGEENGIITIPHYLTFALEHNNDDF